MSKFDELVKAAGKYTDTLVEYESAWTDPEDIVSDAAARARYFAALDAANEAEEQYVQARKE